MKLFYYLYILVLLLLSFEIVLTNEKILWEKEFTSKNFKYINSIYSIYECNNQYFFTYSGFLDDTTYYTQNPGLVAIDNLGEILFQFEESILQYNINIFPRMIKCSNDEILMHNQFIKYNSGASPTISTQSFYNFDYESGNLVNINGSLNGLYQINQTINTLLTDNYLYIFAGEHFEDKPQQCRIDIYNHNADLYKIIKLNMDDYFDLISESPMNPKYFRILDEQYIIVAFMGKDENVILAKYSFDENKISENDYEFEFLWFINYKPENKYIRQIDYLEDGKIGVLHYNNDFIIINENGEFDLDSYVINDNYLLHRYLPLKNFGYIAFYGMRIIDNIQYLTIVITDAELNIIEEISWLYKEKVGVIYSLIEKDNRNLLVYGSFNSLFKEPYYAEVKPGYLTSVVNKNEENKFQIFPAPANDHIFIKGGEINSDISIFNTLGIKIIGLPYTNKIDISTLVPGVYFIKSGEYFDKFVKY